MDLENLALVYMVTAKGGNAGNLFILDKQDAIRLCSDDCSKGAARGSSWLFMWTTIDHYIRNDDEYAGNKPEFVFIKDSGKQDADFARLGIRKLTQSEQKEIIERIGYKYKTK